MKTRFYGALLTAALLLTSPACTASHDSTSSESKADGGGTRTVRPVAGCGANSWTDPAELSPTRTPARCEPGTPAPAPLHELRKLTIATGTLSAEYVAPLQVALDKGEFKKEGLDVTLKVLPTPTRSPSSPGATSTRCGRPPRRRS